MLHCVSPICQSLVPFLIFSYLRGVWMMIVANNDITLWRRSSNCIELGIPNWGRRLIDWQIIGFWNLKISRGGLKTLNCIGQFFFLCPSISLSFRTHPWWSFSNILWTPLDPYDYLPPVLYKPTFFVFCIFNYIHIYIHITPTKGCTCFSALPPPPALPHFFFV